MAMVAVDASNLQAKSAAREGWLGLRLLRSRMAASLHSSHELVN